MTASEENLMTLNQNDSLLRTAMIEITNLGIGRDRYSYIYFKALQIDIHQNVLTL